MKIVAANHADSLGRAGSWETSEAAEIVVLASVGEELRSVYGEADDALPHMLTALLCRLDFVPPSGSDHVA